MRSALLLTLAACLLTLAARLLPEKLPHWLGWLLQTGTTIAAFGGGAYLGLCVLDGDHADVVPLGRLSRTQMLWISLLGVLSVCPVSLAVDLIGAAGGAKAAASGAQAQPAALAALLLKSAVIAPICEELFFRGYLLGALKRHGVLRASAAVSLCFALVHAGGLGELTGYVLLSLLLCLMTLRTQSLLAPVLMHMGYNAALILLGGMGLGGLFAGWSLAACAVRLAGCAAFAAVLRRAYTARSAGGQFELWEGGMLSRREIAALAAAGLLVLAVLITGG
ncbi:MAG: CPBP family intramembrane metalloprotease [Clostridia bacterium]|nr:CPBP family intramembrane metalloprotease [Clostridia bacterium]